MKALYNTIISIAALMVLLGMMNFTSPPPESGLAGSTSVALAHIMSTVELQRELNRRYPKLKLKEDGVYGVATKAAHERAYGDQTAIELRPEDAK